MTKPNSTITLADVAEYGNLLVAHANAKRKKSFYKSVQDFEKNKEHLLRELSALLLSGNYRTSPYVVETIRDGKKERVIAKLPYYPDRIVHWAIMLQVERLFLNRFTSRSHAAIPGRGIHTALTQVRAILKDPDMKFCLKLDIKKYFPHIDHRILEDMVSRMIADEGLRKLLFEIIESAPGGNPGVPIGNYLSQYLANRYLSDFDKWLLSQGYHFVRYMDDIAVFCKTAEEAHVLLREIEWYLARNLHLSVKENWQIFPVDSRPVDIVGYKIGRNYVSLRKSTFKRLRQKCTRIQKHAAKRGYITDRERSTLAAYMGWVVHCTPKCRRTIYRRYFKPAIESANIKLSKKMRKAYGC